MTYSLMMMSQTYNLSIPYWVILHRKRVEDKRVILNFNQYHTWVPRQRNDYKQLYTEQLQPFLSQLPQLQHIDRITYIVYYERNGDSPDTRNITNLIDKFFCDALVHYNIIPDDNHNIILNTMDSWGGVDKVNPRVEITIKGIK